MRMNKVVDRMYSGVLMASLTLAFAGCIDSPATAPQRIRGEAAAVVTASTAPDPHPYEAESRRIAADIPSFAGMWLEPSTGNAIAAVTDARDGAAAAQQVQMASAAQLSYAKAQGLGGGVVVRTAKFSFLTLARWRDSILFWRDAVRVGVRSLDLAEEENVIEVGIAPETYMPASAALLRFISSIGIDPTAIRIIVAEPIRLAGPDRAVIEGGGYTNESLTSQVRPLRGGVQGDAYPAGCTIGFIVKFDGVYYATMAAHCSRPAAVVTPLALGQGGETVGIEAIDPPPYDFWTPEWHYARWNESTLYRISDGVQFDFGRVARPVDFTGSLLIDQYNPYFQISGEEQGGISNGWYVFHVGVGSGWRFGYVSQSCRDDWIAEDNYWVHCSFKASMNTNGGDSGGPVLAPYNNGFIAVGMVWGGTTTNDGIFSGWRGLDMDLTRSFYSGRLFVR